MVYRSKNSFDLNSELRAVCDFCFVTDELINIQLIEVNNHRMSLVRISFLSYNYIMFIVHGSDWLDRTLAIK